MQFYGKVVRCSNKECGMPVFKQIAGRKLSLTTDITDLLTKGKTRTAQRVHQQTRQNVLDAIVL